MTVEQPTEPLTQVVFVHDYLQLVFDQFVVTVYNPARCTTCTVTWHQDDREFAGALVSLIGQTAQLSVSPAGLQLHFSTGSSVTVPGSDPSSDGPEAWQYGALGAPCCVQQNN